MMFYTQVFYEVLNKEFLNNGKTTIFVQAYIIGVYEAIKVNKKSLKVNLLEK